MYRIWDSDLREPVLPMNNVRRRIPDTIRLVLYAVAGGVTGNPVSLAFSGYPPDIVAGIYGVALRLVGQESVAEIGRTADVSNFYKKIHEKRVVLMCPSSRWLGIRAQVDWRIESRRDCGRPLPAVLDADSSKLGDRPAALLVVHGNQLETDAITSWLTAGEMFPEGLAEALASELKTAVQVDFQVVDRALHYCAKHNGVDTLRLRLRHTLRGLLAGAAYVDSLEGGGGDVVRVGVDHYREVYRLLNAESVRPPNRLYDELTVAMVHRANAWLAFKEGINASAEPEARGPGRPKADSGADTPLTAPQLVTLPEIKELGNTQSGSVKRLCEYLRGTKTFEQFRLIGVQEDCVKSDDWPSDDPEELAAELIGWSLKQARTRFDRLREKGVIAATRASNNAPWRFQMPKDAFDGFSPFAGLPAPESFME